MNYDQCKWSEAGLTLSNYQIIQCVYVECPECGSIRQIKDPRMYPVHNTLMGTARSRPQWWKQDRASKVWQLVSDSEVK